MNVKTELQRLCKKQHIVLRPRGNAAIKDALRIAQALGKKRVLIQDQGGWITYKQFAEKLKFAVIEIQTDYGLVDHAALQPQLTADSAVLINAMPGYHAVEDTEQLHALCSAAGALLITDITATIGSAAVHGDIVVCSFAEWKVINLGYGGLLGFDDASFSSSIDGDQFDESFFDPLQHKITRLSRRRTFLLNLHDMVVQDLKDLPVVHPDHEAFNVIIKYTDDSQKLKILEYCTKNHFEYVECPKYIKIKDTAISIEIKRRTS